MKVTIESHTMMPEDIIADAARVCYDSFGKKSPESDVRLIKHLIKSGHHSVLEHASATFYIQGISRACSHQLVRHRLAAYSQRSQRYVKEDGFKYVIPPSVIDKKQVDNFKSAMIDIQDTYNVLLEAGVKPEDARFLLPNACETNIVMSANFREWRHIINERGLNPHAQWEIREMVLHILDALYKLAPIVFEDLYLRGQE